MRRTRFDTEPCPIARATDLMGDWWTPIVMRQILMGTHRFGDLVEQLQIPRAVLTKRLDRLVDEQMVDRVEYQDRPVRYEYQPTQKGREFTSVLAAMWRWSSDWMWGDGEPAVVLADRETHATITPLVVDEATGEPIDVDRLTMTMRRRRSGQK